MTDSYGNEDKYETVPFYTFVLEDGMLVTKGKNGNSCEAFNTKYLVNVLSLLE